MKVLWLFLLVVFSTTKAVHYAVDPNDPTPEDNDAEMWRVLYSKLNRLLDESNTLKETLMDIKQSQNHQGHEIVQLLQNAAAQNCVPQHLEVQTPHAPEHNRHLEVQTPHVPVDNRHLEVQTPHVPEHNRHLEFQTPHAPEHNRRGQWTVILRRMDGSVDFQRNWTDYKNGFGNPEGEFFIGLEKLHRTTTYDGPQELLITLGDWENERRYAKYDLFQIGSEAEQYVIKELGEYSGDAGDALTYHRGMKFSTLDNSNSGLCPRNYGGGWWFNECEDSNLNSVYRKPGEMVDLHKILWSTWKGFDYSLKFAEMKIRPKI
ncbi:microfibril-associated glycoprotein 4-like isoform X2 [Haematobia irritans]|uniref:microfibril-associated glycoprotein 4-like isoform X2 n=1 Tax=Haematobia irritans TaxID=7368 RepID=UPI003F4FF038